MDLWQKKKNERLTDEASKFHLTKLALFQGEQKLFDAAVRHSKEDLSPFSWVMEQADFRQTAIERNCPPTMWT